MSQSAELGDDLDRWLTPFLEVMGRSTRRRGGPLYVRGLLGPDGPKSVQPLAARLGLRGHDQLHHFVSRSAWDDAPLWRVLAEQADRPLGGPEAVLVIDDTVPRDRIGPMLGFKRFRTAAITIAGIELLPRVRKRQFNLSRLRLRDRHAPATWDAVLAAR